MIGKDNLEGCTLEVGLEYPEGLYYLRNGCQIALKNLQIRRMYTIRLLEEDCN